MITAWLNIFNEQLACLRQRPMLMWCVLAANKLPICMRQSTSPTTPKSMTSDAVSIVYSHCKPSLARLLPHEMAHYHMWTLPVADLILYLTWQLFSVEVAMVVEEYSFQHPTVSSISLRCLPVTWSWKLSIYFFTWWRIGYTEAVW